MDEVDAVVIGAGVVGLAVARALALAGREVMVLEADAIIGNGTSSRNSEVIHAGIYYPAGSLKARLCVAGRQMLYAYAEARGIAHRRCGKLIVATEAAQEPALEKILAAAHRNGVTDVHPIPAREALAREPALRCTAALSSPSSGIIDSHGLMVALQGDLEQHGGVCVFNTPILGGACVDGGIELDCGGTDPVRLRARTVVNSAGLHAPRLAEALRGFPSAHVPGCFYAKGNYFSLTRRPPFTRLIYPIPQEAGLGVHLTLDLAGQARFGPDVEWIDAIDYAVDPSRGDAFYAEIRRYWPGLPDGALQPAYAGIRPKLGPAGTAAADFVIQGPAEHGVPGLVNLFGIESPGLTSCLPLAQEVLARC